MRSILKRLYSNTHLNFDPSKDYYKVLGLTKTAS